MGLSFFRKSGYSMNDGYVSLYPDVQRYELAMGGRSSGDYLNFCCHQVAATVNQSWNLLAAQVVLH